MDSADRKKIALSNFLIAAKQKMYAVEFSCRGEDKHLGRSNFSGVARTKIDAALFFGGQG